ncbi:hypothetical protein [Pimelobacter simplex]|uniref:hypothetical protein n=1 Tax=Nocardioides simplex TaxID=2045 RepID=UPI00214FD364|nr:hypothetical protein [Pimelobacter simplex]UUW89101.1 hypothetical protein M0M43_25705 [Pimelobacter simplex]UUW98605.1 hypothetical protein M0M48_14355 [Pimelobacter simplex]
MDGEFCLRRQQHGRGHFAHVRVRLGEATYPSVVLGEHMLDWVQETYGSTAPTDSPYFDALRNGALSGAIYALHRSDVAHVVTVLLVSGAPADTNEEAVRFATAFAVWDALGSRPTPEPTIEGAGTFLFPHPPRV